MYACIRVCAYAYTYTRTRAHTYISVFLMLSGHSVMCWSIQRNIFQVTVAVHSWVTLRGCASSPQVPPLMLSFGTGGGGAPPVLSDCFLITRWVYTMGHAKVVSCCPRWPGIPVADCMQPSAVATCDAPPRLVFWCCVPQCCIIAWSGPLRHPHCLQAFCLCALTMEKF